MTEHERFRYQFLLDCAERGIDPDGAQHVATHLLKQAGIGAVIDGAGRLATNLGIGGLGLAAAAGGTLGYTAAKLREGTLDPEEVKRQELIASYNAFANQLEEAKKHKAAPPGAIRVRIGS